MDDIHSDEGVTLHGCKAEPIAVPVRPDYLAWEYRQMGDAALPKKRGLPKNSPVCPNNTRGVAPSARVKNLAASVRNSEERQDA